MAISSVTAVFDNNLSRVWETVTSLENHSWRSDLSKIEVINEKQFIEYTNDGYATVFTITLAEPCKRWKFDIENDNMKGHWVGVFTQKGERTQIDFTEEVTAKKLIMKPFVKMYLKKQQAVYIRDLSEALANNREK